MERKRGSLNLSPVTCKAIFDAYNMGFSVKDLVQYYKIPQSTISNVIRRRKARHGTRNTVKHGRPGKLDDEALKQLEVVILANRFMTLERLCTVFCNVSGIGISSRRLRGYIHKLSFGNHSAVRKPFIREANKLKRSA